MRKHDRGASRWRTGSAAAEFEAVWRACVGARADEKIDGIVAGGRVGQALEQLVRQREHPTGRQRKQFAALVDVVRAAVIGTLNAVATHPVDTDGKHRKWRRSGTSPEPVDIIRVEQSKIAQAICNALNAVEDALELPEPPRQFQITESDPLLELLQDLLGAELSKESEIARRAIRQIPRYLSKAGVDVIKQPRPTDSPENSPFDFENEDERLSGGGTVILPALVDQASDRPLRRGRVMADPTPAALPGNGATPSEDEHQ